MNKVEFKTEKGSTVKCYIKTKEANLADHRFENDCYRFVVEANGHDLGSIEIVDGCFKTRFPRTINGKRMHITIPATKEALALYESYKKESDRRTESWTKSNNEYQKHHASIKAAMHE